MVRVIDVQSLVLGQHGTIESRLVVMYCNAIVGQLRQQWEDGGEELCVDMVVWWQEVTDVHGA